MAYVIGLDVGGTKIEGVLARAAYHGSIPKVVRKVRLQTHPSSREKTIGNIVDAVAWLYSYGKENVNGFRLGGIGIGTSGFLRNGRMEMVPNIPALKGVQLRNVLQEQLREKGINSSLHVENDSICFVLAESMWGAARGFKSAIGVIVGTGIGGGLVLDGRVYRGRNGGAGHIGHVTIDPAGPRCGCGQFGHFESWCSGKHIVMRYIAAGGKMRGTGPAAIFAAAEAGRDAVAGRVMVETYEKFGIAIAGLINTFNPEVIVLGGGVSNLPPAFYKRIAAAAGKYAYPALFRGVKIIRNRLGDDAGVLGAASLALNG
ncbi:TPA: ROK family protein [Candidatus Woesearchaeota archaeon]|nr:ROK family protein [Candidatus Woesearchaeota archaeon]